MELDLPTSSQITRKGINAKSFITLVKTRKKMDFFARFSFTRMYLVFKEMGFQLFDTTLRV